MSGGKATIPDYLGITRDVSRGLAPPPPKLVTQEEFEAAVKASMERAYANALTTQFSPKYINRRGKKAQA